jgi:hypothetical protein
LLILFIIFCSIKGCSIFDNVHLINCLSAL